MKRARMIGEKVYLRGFERADITEDYLDWVNQSQLIANLMTTFQPITRESAEKYYEDNLVSNNVMFAICDKETGAHIGTCRLVQIDPVNRVCNYGILIGHEDFQSRGYGSDALTQLLRYAFHVIGVNRVWSYVVDTNTGSIASSNKVGMQVEGTLRQIAFKNGEFHDAVVVAILRDEFDEHHGSPESWLAR